MTIWRCSKCGHTETQPASAKNVSHLCGPGGRLVALERLVPLEVIDHAQ